MKVLKAALAASLALSAPALALAEDTPVIDGPITVVVGYAPGGSSDRTARIIGHALSEDIGVPVIIDNRAGAGGRVAAQQFARTEAGENRLMLGNPAVISVAPVVYSEVGYDPNADFQPVSLVTSYTFGLAVPPEHPATTLAELKAHLDEQADDVMLIGVPATGSLPHFFGMMVAEALGHDEEIIGYKGSGQLATELVGGHVPYAIDGYDTFTALHESQKVRLLAVSGSEREAAVPDVPTFKESGYDIEGLGWNGFWAHASMPAEKVSYLNQAIQRVMQRADIQESIKAANMDVIIADLPTTRQMIEDFETVWVPVVQQSGFTH